jgi:hypothetical protein
MGKNGWTALSLSLWAKLVKNGKMQWPGEREKWPQDREKMHLRPGSRREGEEKMRSDLKIHRIAEQREQIVDQQQRSLKVFDL